MIERQKGGIFIPACDSCGTELPEAYDFHEAVAAMHRAGWEIVPPEPGCTTWEHYCPVCARRAMFL